MNLGQFKDRVSHMYLAGAVVQPWSITQEVAGSNTFTVMANISITVLIEFNESFRDWDWDWQSVMATKYYLSIFKWKKR